MNVYEYAMKVEKDGEKYYRELAEKADYSGLKMVFNLLANEEVKHYNVIKNMMKESDLDLASLDINLDTKTVYELLISDKENATADIDEIRFYEEAIRREDGATEFYLEKAAESENANEKQIFELLAAEEKKHGEILQNILDFLREPKNFVEAAEF